MFDSHDTWNVIYNRSNLWMQNTMKLRHSCSIVATHETSCAMRGATGVTHQRHQLLCLPRKMTTFLNDPCHIWNVIYNARSNRQNPPTSPNIASAHSKIWQKLVKTAETWFTVRGRAEHDPRMIRAWSDHEPSPQSAARPRLLFALATSILYCKIKDFPLRLSFQVSPAPATKSDSWTSPSIAPANKSDTVTLLNYYLTELVLLDWTVSLLYWTIPWLNYYFTELLPDWTMIWLNYCMTEPLLVWINTWLNYYLTKLLLDWTMIWLNYYMTEPLVDWIIT